MQLGPGKSCTSSAMGRVGHLRRICELRAVACVCVAMAVASSSSLVWAWPRTPATAAPRAETRGGRRVVVLVDRPNDALLKRVTAEIASLGVTLITIGPPRPHESLGPLEAAARRDKAVAAIRTLPSGRGVEVWMADETSGRSLLRQVIVDESETRPNENLIALQTAELLRTSLQLEPPWTAAPPPPDPSANARSAPAPAPARSPTPAPGANANASGSTNSSTNASTNSSTNASTNSSTNANANAPLAEPERGAAATAPVAPAPTSVAGREDGAARPAQPTAQSATGAELGVGVLHSPGGSDPAVQAWAALYQRLTPHLALALDLSAPLHSAVLSSALGSARLGAHAVGGLARLRLLEIPSVFSASAALGLGALHLRVEGQAEAPLVGSTMSTWTGASYARIDARLAVASWLGVGAATMAGAAFDRVAVQFAGMDVGAWGPTFFGAQALVDVGWF